MSAARLAWTLQEVAATRGGRPSQALREDPVGWAYVLRDAVALAEPDLVVTHDDPALEADALAAVVADGDGDWVDRLMDGAPVPETAPAAATVELVRTLSGLPGYGDRVAATICGPASVAARLAVTLADHGYEGPDDAEELTDLVADALGGLVTAYAAAGATTVVVLDDDGGRAFLDDAARVRAAGPLARAAEHARVTLFTPGDDGVVVLRASAWTAEETAFTVAVGGAAATGGLLLSDGPVPGDVDPARLRAARALAAGG